MLCELLWLVALEARLPDEEDAAPLADDVVEVELDEAEELSDERPEPV